MNNDAPILIDVTRLVWRRWVGRRPTGIDRVCLAYLKYFAARAQAVVQVPCFRRILTRQASLALFDLLLDDAGEFRSRFLIKIIRHFLPALLPIRGRGRFYLNIGHTGLDQPQFAPWAKRVDVRPVYMVHDLIPITHPEYCRPGEADKHQRRMRTVLATGIGVIGNSQETLNQLNHFATSENMSMPPQILSWLGGTPLKLSSGSASISEKAYFVMVGTIEGRKNHLLILNAWTELIREYGRSTPQLRIIGQRGWQAGQVFSMLDHDMTLREHVVEISDCLDEDLALHLAHARALLFPSIVEGYGLPLTEALGAGVPVIASDIPIFREIAGELPEYVDPFNGLAWKQRIIEYSSWSSPARTAQLQRIARYQMSDWQTHFNLLEPWLASL